MSLVLLRSVDSLLGLARLVLLADGWLTNVPLSVFHSWARYGLLVGGTMSLVPSVPRHGRRSPSPRSRPGLPPAAWPSPSPCQSHLEPWPWQAQRSLFPGLEMALQGHLDSLPPGVWGPSGGTTTLIAILGKGQGLGQGQGSQLVSFL